MLFSKEEINEKKLKMLAITKVFKTTKNASIFITKDKDNI
jgi:hypothetical protein